MMSTSTNTFNTLTLSTLRNMLAYKKMDNITQPNGVKWSAEFDAAPGEVRMPASVGSGGLGQKLPPNFLIGWGLT